VRSSLIRPLASVALLVAATVSLAACGGSGVPQDAIATVDGKPIPRSAFAHWTLVAARADNRASVPDPPDYLNCIASRRAAAATGSESDAQLKSACAQSYTQYRTAALEQLTAAEWLPREAARRKIAVSSAEVTRTFEQQKRRAYPKDADYQASLRRSGETEADILLKVKLGLLGQRISAQITKGKDTVTDAEVAAYYAKNRAQFNQATRTLRAVVNPSDAQAAAAAAALKHGESWKTVAAKYSTDTASKGKGGRIGAVSKANVPAALAGPLFSAKRGQIIGPIRSGTRSYVFTVIAIKPAAQQTLAQASAAIKQTLQTSKRRAVIAAFTKDYRKRWRAKTTCADEFKASVCANGPPPTPAPTATATA
jgi:foldase protein PrsA